MNIKNFLLAWFFCFALVPVASAQTLDWYLGIKTGLMTSNISGMGNAANIGLVAGWDLWPLSYGTLSLEGEATTTVDEGDVSKAEFFSGQWSVDTVGLWLAYRSPQRIFGKARIGLNYINSEISNAGRDFSDSSAGLSFGLGGGWWVNDRVSLEAEYTYESELSLVDDDGSIGFWSLGLNCHF